MKDERVCEAIRELGSIIESDLGADSLDELHTVLSRMSAIAWDRRSALKARLSGDIECAVKNEREIQYQYNLLPEEYRW
jgi:hypothetical protein